MNDAGQQSTGERRTRVLPAWWPLAAVIVLYPIWWALGFSMLAWPLVGTFAVLPWLLLRPRILVPRGFGLWLAFLFWVILSMTQIEGPQRLPAFGYRFSVYVSATIFFLFVYNLSAHELSCHRLNSLVAILCCMLALGGLVGVLFPGLQVRSLAQAILPGALLEDGLLAALTQPRFAQNSRLFGLEIGRPTAFFPYTNGWGSAFGLLLPPTLAWMVMSRTSWFGRATAGVVLAVSLVAVIASLNRGLWLSILLVFVVVVIRLAMMGRFVHTVAVVLAASLAAGIIWMSALSGLVLARSAEGHSDEGRTSLYVQSLQAGVERPVLGFGVPQPRQDKDTGPSVGTHGQIWLVLVSQGFVGLGLYLGWWVSVSVRTWRQPSLSGVLMHSTILVLVMQSFVYEHTPIQLPIVMVVAAALLRPEKIKDQVA